MAKSFSTFTRVAKQETRMFGPSAHHQRDPGDNSADSELGLALGVKKLRQA